MWIPGAGQKSGQMWEGGRTFICKMGNGRVRQDKSNIDTMQMA